MWIKIKDILHYIFIVDYCDTCGFTRSKVFLTEIYLESGLNQCEKCIKRNGEKMNSIEVVGIDDFGKNLYYFKSYKEASVFIEKSEVTLYRAIKSGKKFKGCIWKRKSKEL